MRRNIILFLTVGVVVLAGIAAYQFLTFRVVRTSPDRNEFPSFASYVDVYFSKSVKSVGAVTLNGEKVYGEVKIDDKRVRYTHIEKFPKDVESTLEIADIVSTSGQKLDVSYRFTPRYIEFNKLSKEVQEQSIQKSSSGQKDDPFFNNYFPIVKDGYEIEYKQHPVTLKVTLYVTFLAEVFDYDTNQQTYLSNEEAETMRLTVFAQIKALGGSPEKYEIHYANPYLENKYNPSSEHEN